MASLDEILKQMEQLSVEDLLRLRRAVIEKLEQTSEYAKEEAFAKLLHEKGVLSLPNRAAARPEHERPAPVVVEGERVSETIIRERR